MKRYLAALLALMLLLAGMGCSGGEAGAPNNEGEGEASPAPDAAETPAPTEDFPILGLVINDDGSDSAYLTMYGFLHTAETLGYAARVYRAAPGAQTEAAVESAGADGVDALMLFDPTGTATAAYALADSRGMLVAAPYFSCAAEGVDANTVADAEEYFDELARGLAERMVERSLKSGRILVYGRDPAPSLSMFTRSISESYPQFLVDSFTRTAQDEQGAIDELAEYLLYNRDIKGLYVADADASSIAVKARNQAQKTFRAKGAPSPTPTPEATPTPTLLPGQTPVVPYTPNPALLKQIMITIFATGLSDDNYDLFNDNDIYALCIEPYYEAAAQAAMTLDKLLRGEKAAAVSRVNRPLVYNDTADKYKAIYEQMKIMFGKESPQ